MVIKTLECDNPFADYGNIVTGKRFIGREKEKKEIINRVLGANYGNLAVVGLPRIGKSSLVWNSLMQNREDYIGKGIIIDRVNVGSVNSVKQFYEAIMFKVLKSIKTIDIDFHEILLRVKNDYSSKITTDEIEVFFALVKQKFRVIIIMDEFDNIVNLFKIEDFQLLRELSITPETKICLVTISRRTIQELEAQNGAISNFYGVFTDLRLEPFSEKDEQLYWKWVSSLSIDLSNEYRESVKYYVGRHPFWMDLLNYHVFNEVKDTNKSSLQVIEEVKSSIRIDLWNQYDSILNIMNDENLKSPLIQVVIGPIVDLKRNQMEKLKKYGIISPVSIQEKYKSKQQILMSIEPIQEGSYSYISISQHFSDYLKHKEMEFDVWPLWNSVERELRNIISSYLEKKYGKEWRDGFVAKNPKQKNNIENMEKMRSDNQRKFGDIASDNLVRYTYPLDMWNVFIMSDWNYFQKILGGQMTDWKDRFYHLGRVRNPIAHNNEDFVLEDDILKAKSICESIIEKINSFKS